MQICPTAALQGFKSLVSAVQVSLALLVGIALAELTTSCMAPYMPAETAFASATMQASAQHMFPVP